MPRSLKLVVVIVTLGLAVGLGVSWALATSSRRKADAERARVLEDWKRFEPRIAADLEGEGSPLVGQPFGITEKLPRFVDLQNLARLRLLSGLKAGDARPAAREVRARLSGA